MGLRRNTPHTHKKKIKEALTTFVCAQAGEFVDVSALKIKTNKQKKSLPNGDMPQRLWRSICIRNINVGQLSESYRRNIGWCLVI